MKILAFSDLHRDAEKARAIAAASREADVVVGAGDFATRQTGAGEMLDILRTMHCPLVLVYGNHDDPDDLARLTDGWAGAHYLHGAGVTIDGVTFFGVGAEVPARNPNDWSRGLGEEAAAGLLAGCPERGVLVTHSPPAGFCDTQRDGRHDGSTAILAAIEAKRPRLALCGHIHSAWGQCAEIGPTLVHNLGPTVNWHEI